MRSLVILITLVWTSSIFGQIAEIDFLKNFFKEYSPCGMPTYCYDYEFQVEKNVLIISTKLYNGSERELTEITEYRIPAKDIKEMRLFPGGSRDIFIVMDGETIEKKTNGSIEMMAYFPFDFNPDKLTNESRRTFQNAIKSLVIKLSN